MTINLSPEAAKEVATTRYWDGVLDGLREAHRFATVHGGSERHVAELADRIARAERCRARVGEQ